MRFACLLVMLAACGRINFDPLADGSSRANSIFAGRWWSCAVIEGQPWCWGNNDAGQLGDGTTTDRTTPRPIEELSDVVGMSLGTDGGDRTTGGSVASRSVCASRSDGTVACWGRNVEGQVGNGSTMNQSTPVDIGLSDVAQVSVGADHACARTNAGDVYCWGANDSGQLGNGTMMRSLTPVPATIANAIWIDAGDLHTCAVVQGGTVYCWGENDAMQIGLAAPGAYSLPTAVAGITATRVWAAALYTCAERTTGALACWGTDLHGELGDGTIAVPDTREVSVDVVGAPTGFTIAHQLGCATSPDLVCWGDGGYGGLGNGVDQNDRANPTPVAGGLVVASRPNSLAIGAHHVCAIDDDNAVWCWGRNNSGQVGDGALSPQPVPARVLGLP